jgi:hypothetical protein
MPEELEKPEARETLDTKRAVESCKSTAHGVERF